MHEKYKNTDGLIDESMGYEWSMYGVGKEYA